MKEIVDIIRSQIPVFLKLQSLIGDILETIERMTDTPEKRVIGALTTFIAVWRMFSGIRKKIDRKRRP